ncbi:MAG TPA: hypothetical protein VE262_17645 [Blastocatellia bacterium]|nr:hypothetical protein [Blastocatellia bacterium]
MSGVQEILRRLKRVRKCGGGWTAQCPAHDDEHNSLSIRVSNSEKTLIKCHAGCDTENVISTIGLQMSDLFLNHNNKQNKGLKKISHTYDYNDEKGDLLYQVVRYKPKEFIQRRPNRQGGWAWNLNGVRRVPYRLPELLAADPSHPVFITEGEKDADCLASFGLVATTNAGGAGKWRDEYREHLRERIVIILPDNDKPGQDHAERVAYSLVGIASSIKIIKLPGLLAKGDVFDWLDYGHTPEDLLELVETVPVWESTTNRTEDQSRDGCAGDAPSRPTSQRRSVADRLIEYALLENPLLFIDQFGQPHVLIENKPLPLTSRCYTWLRRLMWQNEHRIVSSDVLAQIAGTLAAMAETSDHHLTLHVRSAQIEDALLVELQPGKVVRVDAKGWAIDDAGNTVFRQFANMRKMPMPEPGGSLDTLLDLLSLRDERDKRLLVAYVVTGLLSEVPRPILLTTGPMGSGKTTLNRIIKRILDPTAPETMRLDPRDALQKASHCAVMLCDNLSGLSGWQVDILCRLVTGEGDSKRVLYTDDDDFIVEMKRLVLLNGINPPADRPDFLDRALCIDLDRITDTRRREEGDLLKTFERDHAKWLGCIFDLLSAAMRLRDNLHLSRSPRLADWGRWAAAVYEAAGWGTSKFMSDWWGNVESQQSVVLDSSLLAQTVILLIDECGEWQGSPSRLLESLITIAIEKLKTDPKRDPRFPRTADWLWRRLREILPLLTANGVAVLRNPRGRTRDISLRKYHNNGDDGDRAVINETFNGDTISSYNNGDNDKLLKTKALETNDTNDTIIARESGETELRI